ncbi:hypothetical protein PG990_007678 [Apiospora arundinis]
MLAVAAAQEMAGVRAWKIQGIIRDCPKTENAPNAHPYYKCVVFHCTTAGGSCETVGAQFEHHMKMAIDDKDWLSLKPKLPFTFDLQVGEEHRDAATLSTTEFSSGDESATAEAVTSAHRRSQVVRTETKQVGDMGFNR